MVPIVRAFRDPLRKTIIAVIASQMAKTENVLNVIGQRLDDDPVPTLYIGPTQKLTESISDDRFMKMFRSAAGLWSKLAQGKKNKVTEKWVAGVRIGFGWAGSASELSSHPAGLVIVDERDRMEDIKGEGDPVEMARARLATYADGVLGVVSTPTEGNVMSQVHQETGLEHWSDLDLPEEDSHASPIWKLWQEGTRQEWAWPCPHCGEYFIPRLKHLLIPEGATPARAKREARLVCPRNGCVIDEAAKAAMNARGLYVAPGQRVVDGQVVGELQPNETASFWVSGLCSPWKTFGDRASALVAAQRSGSPGRVRGVTNLQFAELYRMGGDAPDWSEVKALAGGYERGVVPEGAQVLTCAVDVQKNRLVYAVRGWGWRNESWLVEAGEMWGETKHAEVWTELDELLERDFGGKRIRMMLIDSGYNPAEQDRNPDNMIYLFARRHRGRAYPSKGHDHQDKPFKAAKIDVSHRGKVIKNGLDLWHLDSDYFKSWVHARLRWKEGEPGAWHVHAEIGDDYCRQVVAETRGTSSSGKVVWERLRRENHYLDCEAMNAAAAHILRLHALPKPKAAPASSEDAVTGGEPAQAAEKPAQTGAQQSPKRKVLMPPRRNFTTGWR